MSPDIAANDDGSSEMYELDGMICQFLKEQNVPGATLAISKNKEIVYKQGIGNDTSTKLLRGYIFIAVCLCVCLSVSKQNSS